MTILEMFLIREWWIECVPEESKFILEAVIAEAFVGQEASWTI